MNGAEPSEIAAETGGFASQKMFILIRRVGKRRRRHIPTGAAGRAALRAKIENAVGLFSGCKTQEERVRKAPRNA